MARLMALGMLMMALLATRPEICSAQLTKPTVLVKQGGCLPGQVESCRLDCPVHYHDEGRYLCPCYSKLAQCLVQIGCTTKQKVDVFAFCTRKGYCKDGYCTYRVGDLSSRVDVRPEVFALTSVQTPATPCIDNCCPEQVGCAQNASMLAVRLPSRQYRAQEVLLPSRQGDPRLGVNQDYDRNPYSIPLKNLPT